MSLILSLEETRPSKHIYTLDHLMSTLALVNKIGLIAGGKKERETLKEHLFYTNIYKSSILLRN